MSEALLASGDIADVDLEADTLFRPAERLLSLSRPLPRCSSVWLLTLLFAGVFVDVMELLKTNSFCFVCGVFALLQRTTSARKFVF